MLGVITWLSQVSCDHNDIRRFGGDKMWVECLKCGRESDGIRTKSAATPRGRAGAATLHLLSVARRPFDRAA